MSFFANEVVEPLVNYCVIREKLSNLLSRMDYLNKEYRHESNFDLELCGNFTSEHTEPLPDISN